MGPDRAPALITRHVPGRTLTQFLSDARECLDRKEALPQQFRLNRRLEIGCKVCDALAFAHKKGVLHRDIKPDSVWLGDNGEVYLENWGILS